MENTNRNTPIRFTFEGHIYRVGWEAYGTDLILLPDKRALEVHGWTLEIPPKPEEFSIVVNYATHPNAVPAVVEGPEPA